MNLIKILIIVMLVSSCNQKTLVIKNPRCEYLTNPIAVESKTPLLSWELKSVAKAKSQTAYRILAASNPALLKDKKADIWDSGMVPSSSSRVRYAGTPLASRQQAYWTVMVWDENNQAASWSEISAWTVGLLEPADWSAQWITLMEDPFPDLTVTFPAPYFRKEFVADRPVRKATAYVSGLGFYEMYLNGAKVGDQVLAPAITNYDRRSLEKLLYHFDDQTSQRVFYNTFDVTSTLQKGNNTIGAILGNGWYNQRDRTVEGCMWYDTPRLLLQLEVEYMDGNKTVIATDSLWRCTTGPILHDAIFTGEVYDARSDLGNWNQNGYDDSEWKPALPARKPTGILRSQLSPSDQITRQLVPEFKGKVNDSTYWYALPEMISGWAKIRVNGNPGDQIKLRFIGEEQKDFGQSDTYILRGGATEQWEPRFTWHAFRHVEAITRNVKMDENSILIKVVNTDPAPAGTFECSNELFNAVNRAYLLTQKGNFHGSISSDCPHRERLAYTGDAQVIVESSILSFDMTRFYIKWFDDMRDAQNKKTGYVPHTAPFAGGGGGPAWGSAYIIMPWTYFCYYGDTLVLEKHYTGMKQWVEYLTTRTDENGIVVREEPDGWCLGDWCTPVKIAIPEPLVNTAYYYHCAELMSKIASVLERTDDCKYFNLLKEQIKSDFNTAFFNPATNQYWEGRQGANVFPLAFGLVDENHKKAVFSALLDHLESINYHFDTGILATPLLLKVLTDFDKTDIAYRIMNQRESPGFSYLLDDRYTCLWEDWSGRNSRSHPMFGSVVAWFYNTLAGIRVDGSHAGMKHFTVAPEPVAELSFCNGSYRSLHGTIRSEWTQTPEVFNLTVEIPANTTATIHMPFSNEKRIIPSGVYHFTVNKSDVK